ncbi:helix-turn-helix domain-containing protein [Sulfurirhabdus autotrophica]|uniref:Helix-turn-helix protein n=1 Tax=Sulfurirhabdus autotrophica TaxID=1706046 RepID=A0A4R3XT20_9PROT|nr:helix-turn-helix transcriptional regulator [Sulfurirhabdus autotrophica]TCV81067.1 helix-turn-helix protein [Sulfurirhabdus autotrophica]
MKNDLSPEHIATLDRLRHAVEAKVITQTQIASAIGVDQSQVSRILAGQLIRASSNVQKLCKFANQLAVFGMHDPRRNTLLMDALSSVWDGSPEHATAIANVILSLRTFKEVAR